MNKPRQSNILFLVACIVGASFLNASASLTNGLLLHWTFDTDGGATVADESGNGRTGTRSGCQWTTNGSTGAGLVVTSAQDFVVCSDAGFPSGASVRSVSMWVKLNLMSSPYIWSYGKLYAGIPPDNQWNAMLLDRRVGRQQFAFSQDGGVCLSAERVSTEQWYHVVYTYNGGASHKLYINGLESMGGNELGSALNTVLGDGFRVGGSPWGTLNGIIDEVRVYGRVLSAVEVSQLYGQTPQQGGLILRYAFDLDEGAFVSDVSGNGRTGIRQGCQWTTNGALGGSLYISSTNDAVLCSDAGFPAGAASRSVSVWVKLRTMSSAYIWSYGSLFQGVPPDNQWSSIFLDRRVGRQQFAFSQDGGVYLSAERIETGRWYHVVYTYSGGALHKFFINGVQSYAGNELGSALNTVLGNGFKVGGYSYGLLDGWIDDVRVYDKALDEAEVNELYGGYSDGGLILRYTFDTDNGTNVMDVSGHDRHGHKLGGSWDPDGIMGGALRTVTTNDHVYHSDVGFPDVAEPRSVSIWVKLLTMSSAIPWCYGSLFSGVPPDNQWASLYLDRRSGRQQFTFSQDGGVYLSAQRVYTGQWYHVVYTYNGGTSHKLYIDGVDSFAGNELGTALNTVLHDGFKVGSTPYGILNGWVDDVRVYNRAIRADEVHSLHVSGLGGLALTTMAGPNGRIQPSGLTRLPYGSSTNVLVEASNGWYIAELMVDGQDLGVLGNQTNSLIIPLANMISDCRIEATFNHPPFLHVLVSVTSGIAPLRVIYDASHSTDPDGNLVLSELDRDGDGVYEQSIRGVGRIVAEYTKQGVYTSSFQVVDGYGHRATTNIIISVNGRSPVADISGLPLSGNAPLTVNFSASGSVSVPGHVLVVYEWDFDGDGAYDRISRTNLSSWIYSTPGVFQARVQVTDDKGLQDVATCEVTVLPPVVIIPPVIEVTASPPSGRIPLNIQFTANVMDDGSILRHEWDFDGDRLVDRITTNGQTVFTFYNPGVFNVLVTAYDNDGLSAIATSRVEVTEASDLKVWISTPSEGTRIWGSDVTVHAHSAPAHKTGSIQLQVRPSSQTNWVNMGAPIVPPPYSYKTSWDVTTLNGLTCELRAVGVSLYGSVVTSDVVTVSVTSATGGQTGDRLEREVGGKRQLDLDISKQQKTSVVIREGTEVVVQSGTIDADAGLQVEVTGDNTNALFGSVEGLVAVDANRKVSISGDPDLNQPLDIVIPYPDVDQDGFVDGTGIPETTLEGHWYDVDAGCWRRALSSTVLPEENRIRIRTHHLTEFGVFGSGNRLHPMSGGLMVSGATGLTNMMGPANLTDGNTVSHWGSMPTPSGQQDFVYRLTNWSGMVVQSFMLHNYGGDPAGGGTNYSKDFRIEGSLDGSNYWSIMADRLLAQEGAQTFNPSSVVTCRWVRLSITSGVSQAAWNLAEFAVHGTLTDDADVNGMPDQWEMQHFGSFGRDGTGDADGDGIPDALEHDLDASPVLRDTDGDGQDDREEWIAGTGLSNSGSMFKFDRPLRMGPMFANPFWDESNSVWRTQMIMNTKELVFEWETVTGRLYRFYSISNLLAGTGMWAAVSGPITGDGTAMSYTNSVTNVQQRYYRLTVERP